jgi:HD-GYP domain-containing protein (c-di-GMP phosphodiesterase class II)
MGLAFRTFLCSFVPLIILLSGGCWAIERAVISIVHDGLRSVLHDNQASVARLQSHNERQSKRYLRIVGENAALKAGLQLLLTDLNSDDARLTVEDQLREICLASRIDLLFVSRSDGFPVAGVVRIGQEILPMKAAIVPRPRGGFYSYRGAKYQITSLPIDQADERIALLSVGEPLDFNTFNTPVALLRRNKVIESSLAGATIHELEEALRTCPSRSDCEVRLRSGTLLSVAANVDLGDGYSVRSLVNLDAALAPLHSTIRRFFLVAGFMAFVVALIFTYISSRVIVDPIRGVVEHLRESERTGTLNNFDATGTAAPEISELMVGFNRAAAAIRDGQEALHAAYLECVQSLANALDARDQYTAGHSGRVCRFSCAIAQAMIFSREELRKLGIGALLHDIGKIGIPDTVLQKPGRLTHEEFEVIKTHPTVGRRILEAVHGFTPYLDVVELHHENWDGSGYPHGLRGEQVPLAARIVHVADAYDAMTSDRPYRRGMAAEVAFKILQENAGTQFDPTVVDVFVNVWRNGDVESTVSHPVEAYGSSLRRLAHALGEERSQTIPYLRAERSTA